MITRIRLSLLCIVITMLFSISTLLQATTFRNKTQYTIEIALTFNDVVAGKTFTIDPHGETNIDVGSTQPSKTTIIVKNNAQILDTFTIDNPFKIFQFKPSNEPKVYFRPRSIYIFTETLENGPVVIQINSQGAKYPARKDTGKSFNSQK